MAATCLLTHLAADQASTNVYSTLLLTDQGCTTTHTRLRFTRTGTVRVCVSWLCRRCSTHQWVWPVPWPQPTDRATAGTVWAATGLRRNSQCRAPRVAGPPLSPTLPPESTSVDNCVFGAASIEASPRLPSTCNR